jgi:outer membrane protein assembly factor BamB
MAARMGNLNEKETAGPGNVAPRRPIRWWPVAVVLLAAAGGLVWVWGFYGRQRQDKNLASVEIFVLTVFLLFLWCLLYSRIRWKVRFALLGGGAGLILVLAALFRIHGVTGDLLPVLTWRWSHAVWAEPDHSTNASPTRLAAQPDAFARDYPQFMGPNRNATLLQPKLARDWKAQPPERLWLQPVGPGWSGFAVAGNRAITQEQRGEMETVDCYDLLSGAPLWSHGYAAHFQSTLAGEGPRATPTIAGNRVYSLGSSGVLTCLDLATGKLIWTRNIVQENQSEVSVWGISCSPLLVDDLVVVSAGGSNKRSLVAYRAATGDFAWGGGYDGAGYSSPFVTSLAGVRQIVIFNSGGVSAHDPATGSNLWRYPWPDTIPHVSKPVALPDDRLLVSAGYGIGSELLKVQRDPAGKFNVTRIWKSIRLKAKFTDLIYRDGFIYGLDDGIMVCLDAASGDLKWKEGRYGHGQEILVGDLLLITAESGEVILLDPNPQAATELTRFTALNGKTWNPPALAGQYLLVRNDKEAACYRLPVAK